MNRGRQRPAEAACAVGERVKRARPVLPLFALVLFGSAAPAAAQDLQGFGAVVQAAIVSVSVVVGVVMTLLAFWWKFDAKIDQANGKIDANARETTRGLDRTNEKIDAAKKELKDDAQKAHAEIATNIRESEKRLNDNITKVRADVSESEKRLSDIIDKVHATVQLLVEQAIRDRGSDYTGRDRP